MIPVIPDGSITREMLVAKQRRPRGAQRTLTRVFSSATTASEAGTILLSYEDTTGQSLSAPPGAHGYLTLDFPDIVVTNAGATTGPFVWTVDADRRITVEAGVIIDHLWLQGFVLALRVNGHDVASSHYLRPDGVLRLTADVAVFIGDEVTLELRALNTIDSKASCSVTSAAVVVLSR
jgi:hypothetical protein